MAIRHTKKVAAMEKIVIEPVIEQMSADLSQLLEEREIKSPVMIGVQTGGVWVAEQLHRKLEIEEPLGSLGISFYRDDFSRIGLHPQVEPSSLPFSVENRDIILCDDVLYTGRTIRAALNAIFDFGRPNSIILAVLVDRGCRELPVQPDIAGKTLTPDDLPKTKQIKLSGPSPLQLKVCDVQ